MSVRTPFQRINYKPTVDNNIHKTHNVVKVILPCMGI